MRKNKTYAGQWLSDWFSIFVSELKHIFTDSGVMIIFFLAGLAYPLIYSIVYHNGTVDDMPVAVVDNSASAESRQFIRELDATREVAIAYKCIDMAEAEKLMQERKVKGIVMFPADFADKLATMEQSSVSTYADMSSFLYYKNLLMATNHVMLQEMHEIQRARYSALGYSAQQISQLVQPVKYEENMPFNRNFSYGIFFLSAALMIVIQQTMFYGISMLAGTMREENRSFAVMPDKFKGKGISRVVLGRGGAYWLIYMAIGVYVAAIVPRIAGLPQNGTFWSILILLLFYVTACIVFSFTFSTLIKRRETVFVLFLFMSPICLFLTGFSWPTSSFPIVWKLFSYLFPSTFAAQAFINLNTAGADLSMVEPQMTALTIQIIVYYLLSCIAVFVENKLIKRKNSKIETIESSL